MNVSYTQIGIKMSTGKHLIKQKPIVNNYPRATNKRLLGGGGGAANNAPQANITIGWKGGCVGVHLTRADPEIISHG